MHNEGQIIPLITEEGIDTGYSVELARLTYQNTKTEILKLALTLRLMSFYIINTGKNAYSQLLPFQHLMKKVVLKM